MANQYRSVLASSGPAPTGGDALPAEVLAGKTFTNDNGAQTGTMPNIGAVSQNVAAGASYTIPEGYHNGNGVVTGTYSKTLLNTPMLMRVNNDDKYAFVTVGYETMTFSGNINATVYGSDKTTQIGTITSGTLSTVNISGNDVIYVQADSQGNYTVNFTA